MIKIAIVEDETEYVQTLSSYLARYQTEHSVNFQIQVFSDGLDIVSDYTAGYDIILLDIQMKHLDGMKTAEKIRLLDEDVIFIFITSSTQFAVQGYMVDALGYVLKPVPYLAFSQIIGKAVSRIRKKQDTHYLTVDVADGIIRLNTDSIQFIESQLHHILIHSEKGDFLTPGPLKQIEENLKPRGFAKCHHAYLINLMHVTGIQKNHVLLLSGQEVPLSRSKKKSFLDSLTDYLGGISR